MKRLSTGTYTTATQKDVDAYIAEATALVEKYKWQDRTVTPYNHPEKVTKILSELQDYSRCTTESRYYLIDLANGLAGILEAWERHELEPKTAIRSRKTGRVVQVSTAVALSLIADGFADAV